MEHFTETRSQYSQMANVTSPVVRNRFPNSANTTNGIDADESCATWATNSGLPLASVVPAIASSNGQNQDLLTIAPSLSSFDRITKPHYKKAENIGIGSEKTVDFADATHRSFVEMTDDIRRTFLTWFNSIEMDLNAKWDQLEREKNQFLEEKEYEIRRLAEEREKATSKIYEQRAKMQAEQKAAIKQISVEREESRKKLEEERSLFVVDMQEVESDLNRQKQTFRQQVTAFEHDKAVVQDSSLAAQSMVEINVGGTIFQTSKHTISSQKGSFLDDLFAGKHKVVKDSNERVFLDRDPNLFRSVLNFLRNPSSLPYPSDEGHAKSLVEEAKYFGLKYFPYPLVYSIGGNDGVNYLNSVELLDVAEQTWKFVKSMNTERAYCGSGSVEGRLYCFGGQNSDYKVMFDAERYEILRGEWYAAPPMDTPRRNHASTATNNRIFSIGGYDGTSIINTVEVLDERMHNWNYVAPLPSPRSACQAVSKENLSTGYSDIYVLGGTDGKRLDSVVHYDMRADKWESFPKDMNYIRSAGDAVVHMGQLYSFGGLDSMHQVNTNMEMLDLSDPSNWRTLPGGQQTRLDSSCASVSESFLVAGGQYDGAVLDTVEFYRPELAAWQAGPNLKQKRYAHTVSVCSI